MGTGSMRGAAAIVGVADAASPTGELETRGRVLEAAMIREALDDAGLSLADVDGVCCSGMATGIAEYLGIHPRFVDGTFVGGSSFEVHVEHAAAAIAAGLCEVVVGVYASTPRQDRRLGPTAPALGPMGPDVGAEWEAPYGPRMPMTSYALAASRHMAQYGTTSEQLARIAVDARRWAAHNPRARHRDPITVDDVLASTDDRVTAAPARLLPRHRRRGRVRAHLRRARSRPAPTARLRARCRDRRRPLGDHGDARPHGDARRDLGPGGVRARGDRARRRRRAHELRLVHHHRPPPPRGPRLLREGGRGRLRGGRQARPRWRAAR